MPRAIMHFRHAGLNPIPSPTNFIIKQNQKQDQNWFFIPSSTNIHSMETIFHEYLGILWAKIGGD
jgi:uncharacterized SAM-binding protein YcdF (DUF218 family)